VIVRPIESKVFPDLDYLWPKEVKPVLLAENKWLKVLLAGLL
jgi:hypothetical protein